jgi:membrane protein
MRRQSTKSSVKTPRIISSIMLLGNLMYKSFLELRKNDPLRMAGATAFFSTFALPPILLILVQMFGLFVDRRTFAFEIMDRLTEILGRDSALLIRQTLRNVRGLDISIIATAAGFLFLLFIATTLFVVIKNSLDQIWCIGVKPTVNIWFRLKQRALSLGIIMLAGILFSAGLALEAARSLLGDYISVRPEAGQFFKGALNEVIFAIVVTIWFTVLFRFVTDGRPKWKNALSGGIFTAVLFTAGKLTIRYFLALSNIQLIYNTSAAMVLLLLFLFYSAIIFYYGGCFVKIVSDHSGEPIHPVKGAYKFEVMEIIKEKT